VGWRAAASSLSLDGRKLPAGGHDVRAALLPNLELEVQLGQRGGNRKSVNTSISMRSPSFL